MQLTDEYIEQIIYEFAKSKPKATVMIIDGKEQGLLDIGHFLYTRGVESEYNRVDGKLVAVKFDIQEALQVL